RAHLYQLKKSLEAAEDSQRVRRLQLYAGRRDLQAVRFIFAHGLDFLRCFPAADHKFGVRVTRYDWQRNSCLPGKSLEKPNGGSIQPRLTITVKANGERRIYE